MAKRRFATTVHLRHPEDHSSHRFLRGDDVPDWVDDVPGISDAIFTTEGAEARDDTGATGTGSPGPAPAAGATKATSATKARKARKTTKKGV